MAKRVIGGSSLSFSGSTGNLLIAFRGLILTGRILAGSIVDWLGYLNIQVLKVVQMSWINNVVN